MISQQASSPLPEKDDESSLAQGSERASTASGDATSTSSKEESFVEKETKRVFYLRLLVVAVLLAASAAVSSVVFLVTEGGEDQEYLSQYESAASKVQEAFLAIARDKMGSIGALVVALVAHGVDHTRSWPFVTLSSFQQRSMATKRISGALSISTHPIVWREDRKKWENYTSLDPDRLWYQQGRDYQIERGIDDWDEQPQVETEDLELDLSSGIASHIYNFRRDNSSLAMISPRKPFYLPVWQTSPVTRRTIVNQNAASSSDGIITCLEKDAVVFEGMQTGKPGFQNSDDPFTSEVAWLLRMLEGKEVMYQGDILTSVYFPVFNSFADERLTVGVMQALIYWQRYFANILPDSIRGIIVVLDDGCDEPYTYQINGGQVIPLGRGDLHDTSYDSLERTASLLEIKKISDGTKQGLDLDHEKCPYGVRIYPSRLFYDRFHTRTPLNITFAVGAVFVFTVFMFVLYDRLVEKRQQLILLKAKQTHKIVASLFPKNVRRRLLKEQEELDPGSKGLGFVGTKSRLKTFIKDGEEGDTNDGNSPIADLFPEATVFFCDIAGFTAWSSTREPAQVFMLLQSLYKAYDKIANRHNVFKVETIGDSYVAATGLPEPQPKHAVIMARFAAECLMATARVTRELEPTLGPGTADLNIRVGIHSGQVTAGVLVGERARFQLFGDTVNTAARMESTGKEGLIQVSKHTADLLIASGKEHWVRPRADDVLAKGKGVLQTFWVSPHSKRSTSKASTSTGGSGRPSMDSLTELEPRRTDLQGRLVDWMSELMLESIRKIKVKHAVTGTKTTKFRLDNKSGQASVDELVDSFHLFTLEPELAVKCSHDRSTVVSDEVRTLLKEYIVEIASRYTENPFHNFEHACHVTMCASKFLNRINSPELDNDDKQVDKKAVVSHLQDYTHGIYSDPVAMFAIIFAALIHDIDHPGVSNTQLMKEDPSLAEHFKHQAVAEQKSLDIAWNLLVSDRFQELREGIFASQEEFAHFRQVVVNVVLSTDIFDKDMSDLRKKRWDMAFTVPDEDDKEDSSGAETVPTNTSDDSNGGLNDMRATVVMEHIIQASDVSHTMQHWHIYRKWNKNLFMELCAAYRQGRLGADPCSFWYQGELNFFDNYVIPLAKKLKDCKVFGVSSDECLNYALRNREEWQVYGESIVEEMKAELPQE